MLVFRAWRMQRREIGVECRASSVLLPRKSREVIICTYARRVPTDADVISQRSQACDGPDNRGHVHYQSMYGSMLNKLLRALDVKNNFDSVIELCMSWKVMRYCSQIRYTIRYMHNQHLSRWISVPRRSERTESLYRLGMRPKLKPAEAILGVVARSQLSTPRIYIYECRNCRGLNLNSSSSEKYK